MATVTRLTFVYIRVSGSELQVRRKRSRISMSPSKNKKREEKKKSRETGDHANIKNRFLKTRGCFSARCFRNDKILSSDKTCPWVSVKSIWIADLIKDERKI